MSEPHDRIVPGTIADTPVATDRSDLEGVAANRSAFPDLLGATEVAALLRITERALRDWDRRGWLTPVRLGRQKFYATSEVLRVLQNGTPINTRITK